MTNTSIKSGTSGVGTKATTPKPGIISSGKSGSGPGSGLLNKKK